MAEPLRPIEVVGACERGPVWRELWWLRLAGCWLAGCWLPAPGCVGRQRAAGELAPRSPPPETQLFGRKPVQQALQGVVAA